MYRRKVLITAAIRALVIATATTTISSVTILTTPLTFSDSEQASNDITTTGATISLPTAQQSLLVLST